MDTLNVFVNDTDGTKVGFKVNNTMKFKKLMDAYCHKVGKESGSLQFLFNGYRISPDSTPNDFGMQDEDEIDVMLEGEAKINSISTKMDKMMHQMNEMQTKLNDLELRMNEEQKNDNNDDLRNQMNEMNKKINIPMSNNNNDNSMNKDKQEFKQWITVKLNLPEYYDVFVEQGIDTLKVVQLMTKEELIEMGINKVGHRMQILKEIQLLQQQSNANQPQEGGTAYV